MCFDVSGSLTKDHIYYQNKVILIAATFTLADTFKIGYLSGNRNPDGDIDISLPGLSIRYFYNIATFSH